MWGQAGSPCSTQEAAEASSVPAEKQGPCTVLPGVGPLLTLTGVPKVLSGQAVPRQGGWWPCAGNGASGCGTWITQVQQTWPPEVSVPPLCCMELAASCVNTHVWVAWVDPPTWGCLWEAQLAAATDSPSPRPSRLTHSSDADMAWVKGAELCGWVLTTVTVGSSLGPFGGRINK